MTFGKAESSLARMELALRVRTLTLYRLLFERAVRSVSTCTVTCQRGLTFDDGHPLRAGSTDYQNKLRVRHETARCVLVRRAFGSLKLFSFLRG